ncbi:uncharacterized protein FIBRA_05616 [Fibroporia radiculosa]|uniref:BRCT domain-containing protein n=1 Tax=Fibroporia radiculosa TaxID=599839 RepID=J4HXU4_9APHY|nr:uncharacterized protein FIBRA_05616 [Fibroporia radiculosa]CCM03482.1 predicted protein [Fibroporia radiculosa]
MAALLADVRYFISRTLRPERRQAYAEALDSAGALAVSLDDPALTHLVASTPPSDDALERLPQDSAAHVVTPAWVERSIVLKALQPPEFYSTDPAFLFSGITATATDMSPHDLELLSAAITALGGQWRTTLTRDVTHLFALSTGSLHYETAMHFQDSTHMKILVPHWFEDSIRLGIKGLPTDEYEWPEPAVFKGRVLDGAQDSSRPAYRLSAEKKAYFETALASGSDLPYTRVAPRNVWNGLRVLLSSSLGLTESQREAHEADIRREGGLVVELPRNSSSQMMEDEAEKVREADVFVTRHRAGSAYVKAYKLNKTIGSLTWLWFVRASGTLSRPTDQLLHYPIPKKPIEGFSSHIITITNYTGKHREYLKKLIATMGAEFTPSMSSKNTVVIAAFVSGTKTAKATSWSIPVVNHTWLEDCFVQWRALTPAREKYIIFPPGMDFSQLLADRGLGGRVGFEPGELEALETENQAAPEREADVGRASALSGTANSARDAREVEKAVDGFDNVVGDVSIAGHLDVEMRVDEDVEMITDDGTGGRQKGRSVAPTDRKPARIADREEQLDADRASINEPSTSLVSPSKPLRRYSRKGNKVVLHGHSEEPVTRLGPPTRAPAKDKMQTAAGESTQYQRFLYIDSLVGSGARERQKLPQISSDEEDPMDVDDLPVKSKNSNINVPAGKGSRPPRKRPADETDPEDEHEKPASRSEVSASVETAASPVKATRTPTKRLSVVLPTVTNVYSPSKGGRTSPRKAVAPTTSVRAETAETLTHSPAKRDRLPASPKKVQLSVNFDSESELSPPVKSRRKKSPAPSAPVAGPSRMGSSPPPLGRTPSKRSAASRATQKLRDEIMPDVLSFQKEMKRGNVRGLGESEPTSAKGKEKEKEREKEAGGVLKTPKLDKAKGRKRLSAARDDDTIADEEPEKKRPRTTSTGGKNGKTHRPGHAPEELEGEVEEAKSKARRKPASKGRVSVDEASAKPM